MIQKGVIILGIICAIIPHLGFPNVWEIRIITVLGLLISTLAFIVLRRHETYPRA